MTELHNQLSTASSTYLLQHADNPVHWQLWSDETLHMAKSQDRPILLSIGYAACHWCHVMADESFADESIARLMNMHFINIKLDRQERPDIDSHFQLAHQLFTGRGGGWPLTVFIDPQDLTPFFAGTYFPAVARHGMPGFDDILKRLATYFTDSRDTLKQQSLTVRQAFTELQTTQQSKVPLSNVPLQEALKHVSNTLDRQHGGFGGAPKFPRCPELNLLQIFADTDNTDIKKALQKNLQSILDGGLYDHLGGGFFRYCVDENWCIPHFEKMLYDNAQLLPLLAAHADRLIGAVTAMHATIDWLQRRLTMTTPSGHLYAAALDADSHDENLSTDSDQHTEGAYYLWQPEQIKALLDESAYADFAAHFGLDQPANFERHAWHLQGAHTAAFDEHRKHLLTARQQRELPALDRQALCSWNAMLADGFLRSGYCLSDSSMIERGQSLLDTLWNIFWVPETGHLYHHYAADSAHGTGFLDDIAALLLASVIDLQKRLTPQRLQRCRQLADTLLDRYYDPEQGGFYLATAELNEIDFRNKPLTDDATPSGNGLSCLALQRLGHLTGDNRYLQAAVATLQYAQSDIARYPTACATLLIAQNTHLSPTPHSLISGIPEPQATMQWLARNDTVSYFIEPAQDWHAAADSTVRHFAVCNETDSTIIQICSGTHCLPVCHSLDEAEKVLYKERNN